MAAVIVGGAEGTVATTAIAPVMSEAGPTPSAFAADTWNTYDVPFTKPVTVAEVNADTPSLNVDQLAAATVLYCTT